MGGDTLKSGIRKRPQEIPPLILIKNYEVEIYVQDTNEPHHSTGVYSIKNSEWIARPEKRNAKFDEEMVKKKSESLMDQIDRAHDLFDDKEYLQSYDYADKLKKKIRIRNINLS